MKKILIFIFSFILIILSSLSNSAISATTENIANQLPQEILKYKISYLPFIQIQAPVDYKFLRKKYSYNQPQRTGEF